MRILILCALSMAAGAADLRWMISFSAARHLDRVDPSGALSLRFFSSPGNFVMNGKKGSQGFPQGWRCAPTATFPSYAALKDVLDRRGGRSSQRPLVHRHACRRSADVYEMQAQGSEDNLALYTDSVWCPKCGEPQVAVELLHLLGNAVH